MSRLQPIYNLTELCTSKGIDTVVVSPGSRCAPLTLAFVRHPACSVFTIPDERSAAYMALGMAQATGKPVILVCTSGTAAANYGPAVAEACFANVPLIVFTADRPVEWIGQQDGQTIYQHQLFGPHVKRSYQLPQHYEANDQWSLNRMVNEGINLATTYPVGPVHFNVPLVEPLYPAKGEEIAFEKSRIVTSVRGVNNLDDVQWAEIFRELESYPRVLIHAGQLNADPELRDLIQHFSTAYSIPVIGDILSNLHGNKETIRYADLFLPAQNESTKKELQPDCLLTLGQAGISKNLKLFLRHHPAREQWHVEPVHTIVDTYQQLTRIIEVEPKTFFRAMLKFESSRKVDYKVRWDQLEKETAQKVREFLNLQPNGELKAVADVLHQLKGPVNLHLANSMSVRYANLIGLSSQQQEVVVWSNRGTSGIDGSTSTAVGHALTSSLKHCLITGDMAFFYDRNAFWHNYKPENLAIILLNNHGGAIFRMIDGPSGIPESEEYFVTHQPTNAAAISQEYSIYRQTGTTFDPAFLTINKGIHLFELEDSTTDNKTILEALRTFIANAYGT